MSVNSEYASAVLANIAKLNNEVEKVTLIAGRDLKRVRVHRVLLAATSNHFATLLGGKIEDGKIEITLDDTDGNLLNGLVSFLYSGQLQLNDLNVRKYMKIALKYELKQLRLKCSEYRCNQVTTVNCIDWLEFADKNYMENLRSKAIQVVCKEFANIPSAEMCTIDFENFEEIIRSDANTAPEEMIFDRLVEWVERDELGRSQYVADLLKCVRLKHIPTKALIEKVDVFSTRFNVIDWTKDECYERLRRSKPIHSHRFGSEKALFERYEAVSGNWHIRRYFGDSEIWEEVMTIFVDPPMKYCGVVFRDTKFFVIGGSTRDEKFSKSIVEYDLEAKTRKKLPDMRIARDDFCPIMIGQFIYVCGGLNEKKEALANCERFDTQTKKWKVVKPMNFPRYAYAAAVVNGCIFVAGGYRFERGRRNSVACYDPDKDQWTKVARVMDPRFEGILVEWKSLLYAVGVNKAVERYNSEKNEWEQPDDSETGDAILSALATLPLTHNEEYRQQIQIHNFDYFDRFGPTDAKTVFLADFTETN